MNQDKRNPAIIVALDVPSHGEAIALAKKLDPKLCSVKVGLELFTAAGPPVVETLQNLGFEVFLDLKYHDIPNTVAGAVRAAANLGVWMINVHTLGGSVMMRAAVETLQELTVQPLIIGVTVLTSMDAKMLEEVGIHTTPREQVLTLARNAVASGLSGVVCSGEEASMLRDQLGADLMLITPGIRLPDGNKDDQKRIVTPEIAIKNGANYLVVGRPITEALDPLAALADFNERVRLAWANLT